MSAKLSATERARDGELVKACRAGREDAFAELVERHQDRAFSLAYRLTGNRDDAAEAVQEAFLKAFRGLDGFRGEAVFYTWFFRIVVNVVRSRQRFRAVRPTEYSLDGAGGGDCGSDARGPAVSQVAGREAEPSAEAERLERKALLERALAKMDVEQRMMIVLRDIDGRDYAEIAGLLECPRGTVKSRLHRARLALRTILAPALALDEEAAR